MIFGQAAAARQWLNYAAAQAPIGSTILRLNLDKTSVKLFQGGGKGPIFSRRRIAFLVAEVLAAGLLAVFGFRNVRLVVAAAT